MLSSSDLEKLIAAKKREIEKEKTLLGLLPPPSATDSIEVKENVPKPKQLSKVSFTESRVVSERDDAAEGKSEKDSNRNLYDLEEAIPPDLERYIRRYIGLPVMLKAGEYSPNNPLVRGERSGGDALLGLGEYERRRHTLRRHRQLQYKEYLDQQAKKKQEAKQQAEKERREQEERERQREIEEQERERLERDRESLRRRTHAPLTAPLTAHIPCVNKVDTGIQVDVTTRPLSVAVQTDEAELYEVSPSQTKYQLTEAERELSPRTVEDGDSRPKGGEIRVERRRSYGDFDERTSSVVKRTNREKLVSDLRHSYMPSIFDADAIHLRNLQAEKDAAARRQFYQQELKNQILEQQRIKEERKSREKLLEQAEMRRLEEQLRMLRVAQEREVGRHHDITTAMKDNTSDYNNKRTQIQHEIDQEHQKLLRATNQPRPSRNLSSVSDNNLHKLSKLPFHYPQKKTYSTNIPDTSLFSSNYDVDSYLRKNLKFDAKDRSHFGAAVKESKSATFDTNFKGKRTSESCQNFDRYTSLSNRVAPKDSETIDSLPIPVLRHSETRVEDLNENCELSDAMRKVDDKWKVPAVQKNILKSLPNEDGKNLSILTQLGSIRRQLQLEQLKLDIMVTKEADQV